MSDNSNDKVEPIGFLLYLIAFHAILVGSVMGFALVVICFIRIARYLLG
jgi:hypothetical protein